MLSQPLRLYIIGLLTTALGSTLVNRCAAAACPYFEYQLALTAGGTESDRGFDVLKTQSEAVVIVGDFQGTVDLDPTDSVDLHVANGDCDVFVTYLNADGSYAWSRTVGGQFGDTPYGVVEGKDSSLFVVGVFQDTVDFDPTEGVDERESIGEWDAFVMKLAPAGDYEWTVTYGSESGEAANAVHIGPDGNIYIVGTFGLIVDFDPSSNGAAEFESNGGLDAFVTKITPDGVHLWTRTIGGPGEDRANGVKVDGDYVHVAGEFSETVDFDSTEGVDEHTSHGSRDAFVSKFSTDGAYLWTWTAGGAEFDLANDVAIASDDGVIITGAFNEGVVDFDPGEGTDEKVSNGTYDAFITKLSADGSYEWTQTFGAADVEFGEQVATTPDGAILVAGSFGAFSPPGYTVDFHPQGGDPHVSNGGIEIFVTTRDINGDYLWTYTAGGIGNDKALAIDVADDDILVSGYFAETVDFDPTDAEDIHTSNGSLDIFLTTLTCSDEPPACDGDANGDGVVDPLDSGYVLSRFGCPVNTGDEACDTADVNTDGVVDPLDVGYVLSRFGLCK